LRCYCKKCADEFDWPFRIESDVSKADAIGECLFCGNICVLSKDWSNIEMTCRECNCDVELKVVEVPPEERQRTYHDKEGKHIKMCHLGVIERRQLCYYHRKKNSGLFNLPTEYFRAQHEKTKRGETR
jgi:hypothetical protein